SIPKTDETPLLPTSITPLIMPLENLTINKKSKTHDKYERLAEEMNSLTMNSVNVERKVSLIYFFKMYNI
ncbi:unnamed protein product, partial [Rotaria socialis]